MDLTRQTECTGCGACMNICPKEAIRLMPDEAGFLYPQIDQQLCVDCSLCRQVCHITHLSPSSSHSPSFYALINKNSDHLKASSSGGAFLAVAEYVFSQGGVVAGCGFDKDHKAVHQVTHSLEQCIQSLCGSKYVQSETGSTFREVKELLSQGRLVLYTGTPCQIEGLLLFLKKKPDNLITMDLICHGVSSPLLWKRHKEYLEKQAGDKLEQYRFRDKTAAGWSLYYRYHYGKNKQKHGPSLLDRYYTDFLKGANYRPSCYQCQFANLNRVGDLTIGDFWGAEKYLPDLNLKNGVSLVIVNSQLGQTLLQTIQDRVILREVTEENAVAGNHNLVAPTPRPAQRDGYYTRCFQDFDGWEKSYITTRAWKLAKLKSLIPAPIKRLLGR